MKKRLGIQEAKLTETDFEIYLDELGLSRLIDIFTVIEEGIVHGTIKADEFGKYKIVMPLDIEDDHEDGECSCDVLN